MAGSAAYHLAPRVGWVDGSDEQGDGGICYLAPLPDGPPLVLRDSAAAIWVEARVGGTADEIAGRVAERFGLESDEIGDDVATFLEELVELGVLSSA